MLFDKVWSSLQTDRSGFLATPSTDWKHLYLCYMYCERSRSKRLSLSVSLSISVSLSLTHSEKCINASMEENVSHGRVIIKYIMIKYLDIFLLCVSWILPYCVLVFGLHTDSEEVDKSQIGLSGAGIKNSRS